jgi:hypothetical protein
MKKFISISGFLMSCLYCWLSVQSMYADSVQPAALAARITEIRTLRAQRDQELNDTLGQIQTMLIKLSDPNAKTLMTANYDRAMKSLESALKVIFVHVGPASLKELAPAKAKAMEAWSWIVNTPQLVERVSIPGA